MKRFRDFLRVLVIGLSAGAFLAPSAQAFSLLRGERESAVVSRQVMPVANDCYAIGMQRAAQAGGQLARATPETRGGRTVCVIVVLMPAKDGQRPRRNEIVVPLG